MSRSPYSGLRLVLWTIAMLVATALAGACRTESRPQEGEVRSPPETKPRAEKQALAKTGPAASQESTTDAKAPSGPALPSASQAKSKADGAEAGSEAKPEDGKESGAGAKESGDAGAGTDTPSEVEKPLTPAQRKAAQARAELEKKLELNLAPVNPEKPEGADAADPNDPYITAKALERRLGPPLVDNPEKLVRLDPNYPLWIDRPPKNVIMVGAVCQRQVPLELFACLKGSKEHEAFVTVHVKASRVHAALLAAGAEAGAPVQFRPTYVPAHGTEIEVTVIWKDEQGRQRRARAQDWVRQGDTKKAMEHPWVFAGSQFGLNEVTGQQRYRADAEGDFICVSNFPGAMLDLPIQSSSDNTELAFECFTEHIPLRGTPVTIVLTPKLKKDSKPAEPKPKTP